MKIVRLTTNTGGDVQVNVPSSEDHLLYIVDAAYGQTNINLPKACDNPHQIVEVKVFVSPNSVNPKGQEVEIAAQGGDTFESSTNTQGAILLAEETVLDIGGYVRLMSDGNNRWLSLGINDFKVS